MVAIAGRELLEALEKRVFIHKCQFCGWHWDSDEKADVCPRCEHWNITMSSRLKETSKE